MARGAKTSNRTEEASGFRLPSGSILLGILLLAAFGGGAYALWKYVQPRVLAQPEYYVTNLDGLIVTPPPEWIHADVRAEVFRDLNLENPLSLMDEQLTRRVADAFLLHPWVAKVNRVVKQHPGRLMVELEYRKPVAMVEVPGGLLPVDATGRLLPCSETDFTPIEASRYPRIAGIKTLPLGAVGAAWGDPRVSETAEIAAALGELWKPLHLQRIVPGSMNLTGEVLYELYTQGGMRVVWGRAPSRDGAGEPLTAEKIARLRQFASENGSLDRTDGPKELDLRLPRKAAGPPTGTSYRSINGSLLPLVA